MHTLNLENLIFQIQGRASRSILFISIIFFSFSCFSQQNTSLVISNAHTVAEGQIIHIPITPTSDIGKFQMNVRISWENAEITDLKLVTSMLEFDGTKTQHISIQTLDDQIVEEEETIKIFLSTLDPKVELPDPISLKIIDNDKTVITVDNISVAEGDSILLIIHSSRASEVPFEIQVNIEEKVNSKVKKDILGWKNRGTWTDKTKDLPLFKQKVLFEGKAEEKQEMALAANRDRIPNEGLEQFNVTTENLSGVSADVTDIGLIEISDYSECVNCPPKSFLARNISNELRLFGDGAVNNLVEVDQKKSANTGMGIQWIEHFPEKRKHQFLWFYKVELEGHVNFASTIDTIHGQLSNTLDSIVLNANSFGNSILVPASSGSSGDIRLRLYNKNTWGGFISGLYAQYSGANRNWTMPEQQISISMDTSIVQRTTHLNSNLFRIGLFHDFINYDMRDDFSVLLRAGYAANWVAGDIAQDLEILEKYLGSDQTSHHGWEGRF